MRMKLNNKGYSLVELMLTLFIFGIVMVGVGMIMRTTSASYKSGNAEVTMQTEAQILANQVEELLVDAASFAEITGDAVPDGIDRCYKIETFNSMGLAGDGNWTYYLLFNSAEKRIYMQVNSLANDSTQWSLMGEYVADFRILGYTNNTTLLNCDNMVNVEIDMDKAGYKYSAEKEVHFRNDIENPNVQLINGGVSSGDGDDDEFDGIIELDRYEILDLEREYNFDLSQPVTIDGNGQFALNYRFVTATYNSNNYLPNKMFDMSAGISTSTQIVKDDAGNDITVPKPTAFITTTSTLNSDFDGKVPKTDADDGKCWISGTTHDDKTVKYKIVTNPVSYKVEGTVNEKPAGTGALLMSPNDGDPGRDNWVEVEGINFCHMVEYPVGGQNMKLNYKLTLYDDGAGSIANQYDKAEERKIGDKTASILSGFLTNASTLSCNQVLDQPKYELGLRIDPLTGDLSVMQGNGAATATTASNNGNMRMACMIGVTSADATATYDIVFDMAVVVQSTEGQTTNGSFANYDGGSSYTPVLSVWN